MRSKRGVGRRLGVLAPAKINLFLHVGGKRRDGYHTLESLVVFAETGDRMEFAPSSRLRLRVYGRFARALPAGENNLVIKAARALVPGRRGAAISLEKNLPVAAGLGGGSADAAATLRALNVMWERNLNENQLLAIAATIGADVPASLMSRPLWMSGRGERVHPVGTLPPLAIVLVNPGIKLATASVFGALEERTGLGAVVRLPPREHGLWDIAAYLERTDNDLREPACRLKPVVGDVLEALEDEPGCVWAQMSGSGATCFGLFDGRHHALAAAESIAHAHPRWWVRATRTAGPDIGAPHWEA